MFEYTTLDLLLAFIAGIVIGVWAADLPVKQAVRVVGCLCLVLAALVFNYALLPAVRGQ